MFSDCPRLKQQQTKEPPKQLALAAGSAGSAEVKSRSPAPQELVPARSEGSVLSRAQIEQEMVVLGRLRTPLVAIHAPAPAGISGIMGSGTSSGGNQKEKETPASLQEKQEAAKEVSVSCRPASFASASASFPFSISLVPCVLC
jgi:hypothetical protein